ncbi:Codeine O-demethylase, partial [Mucuna pruriens]
MTNGIYKSTMHRAVVNSEKERLSIATFYGPEWSGNIGPAPTLVTPDRPAVFKTIGVADFYKGYLSPQHLGKPKSYLNDVLRIQNGHSHQNYDIYFVNIGSKWKFDSRNECDGLKLGDDDDDRLKEIAKEGICEKKY